MFHVPSTTTLYYRVTRRRTNAPSVLSGMGSYYTLVGRYHRPQQRTVYAADDAMVSITEMAYYQALEWQERIGGGRTGTPIPLPKPVPPTYPLVSSHLLWCFMLDGSPTVIDVDDPIAYATFQHAPIHILNLGQVYTTTQGLSDRIRAFTPAHHPRPQGIKAPTVRTPPVGGYQPYQYALFVMSGRKLKGQVLWKADLTLEFLDQAGNPVNSNTRDVAWSRPQFQLNGLPAAIPAFSPRPGSRSFHPGHWYRVDIRVM